MSGGSYQYAYSNLEHNFLYEFQRRANTPQRKAFAKHLEKVITAMHDIEWVDSGDYGDGDENAAIMDCVTKTDVVKASVDEAKDTIKQLESVIEGFGKDGAE
jgi:hypothetical protein